ncbi:ParB family protein [Pengzhenrongella sp.]|jgi:hypothetical protein|uniref:ParB family protein n=1 Tax=Pengzhenrongella sp. TaxID=2888820 RepID=UPI002F949EAD
MSSQPEHDRSVAGPPPRPAIARRPPDATRLIRDNRTPASIPAEAEGPSGDDVKEQITVAISADVRQRSRAAFREARYREGVRTYADFVGGAIDREIKRIEATYNEGETVPPDAEHLPRGRSNV